MFLDRKYSNIYCITFLFVMILAKEVMAQKTIVGAIQDEKGMAIPFVRVGVAGTRVGLMSNESGQFQLEIPSQYLSDQLTFQVPGYNTISLEISELITQKTVLVKMTELFRDLGEVVVFNKSPKTKILGNTGNRKTSDTYDSIKYDGNMAYIIKVGPNNKPYLVKELSVSLGNKYDEPYLVRPLIFSVNPENGLPYLPLINVNRVFKVEKGNSWVVMDLSDLNLQINGPIYIGAEWIGTQASISYFRINSNFKSSESYFRTIVSEALANNQESIWHKYERSPLINIKVSY